MPRLNDHDEIIFNESITRSNDILALCANDEVPVSSNVPVDVPIEVPRCLKHKNGYFRLNLNDSQSIIIVYDTDTSTDEDGVPDDLILSI